MEPTRFTTQAPGQLVANFEGRQTFLPDPLFPVIQLTPASQTLITDVSVQLGGSAARPACFRIDRF